MNTQDPGDLAARLAEPFAAEDVKFKPAVVSGNRALALAYTTARAVMDRLDAVVGVANWQDDYEVLASGDVVCRLRVRLGDEWITKVDVGSKSEQPDEGDQTKAGFSDALKRAAVKYGIGRYLYRLPSAWHDYDPKKKQFVKQPTLPAFATPKSPEPAPAAKEQPAAAKAAPVDWSGRKLLADVRKREAELCGEGLCKKDELVALVDDFGTEQGFPDDALAWNPEQVRAARAFLAAKVNELKAYYGSKATA